MRLRFHKERDKRYLIAIEELQRVFQQQKGWEVLLEATNQSREVLPREEDIILDKFERLVKTLLQDTKRAYRQHQKVTAYLRHLLRKLETFEPTKPWHSSLLKLVYELCLTKYHRTHFYSFGSILLSKLFSAMTLAEEPLDHKDHFSNYNFLEEAHMIEESNPRILFERDFRKFDENFLKRHFDSHRYNLPHLLYTLAFYRDGQVARLQMVRMGCPTKEGWFQPPKVVPEFRGFIAYLASKGQKHLYINKQKTWGEEGRRSEKLHELDQEMDNLHVVSLPSDGDFYNQQGRFREVNQMNIFKPLFARMLRCKINSGYYYVPKAWREDPKFCLGVSEVLDEVHTLYFGDQDQLDHEERKLFIDLSYTHLILFFLSYSKVQSVNITCRDGIDRAGCEQSKLLFYFQISLGIEEELDAYRERQFTQHIPVYFAKTRAIVPERRQILQQAYCAFTPKVKEKIREKHQKTPIVFARPHFVKRKQQSDLI